MRMEDNEGEKPRGWLVVLLHSWMSVISGSGGNQVVGCVCKQDIAVSCKIFSHSNGYLL